MLKYRPDIDGLRAFAVLAVVGFHTFPESIRAGFIGVDIFFVISGYLICANIFQSLEKGTFSFSDFYGRRVRRIFPALILVLLSCLVVGWVYFLTNEYGQLGKHLAAGSGFISNLVFWNEVGYFDNAADTKPLLHLWSLGIEEQFYIFWPILLWISWRRRFNLLLFTILVALVSFYLNLSSIIQNPIAAFYSPLTRFWELLIGSLLAYVLFYKENITLKHVDKFKNLFLNLSQAKRYKVALINIASLTGVLLIAYGFRRINNEQPYPGPWALLPVLGAALIITAGQNAYFNRVILSNKIAVSIGLISFPLYLWHWPLLSFNRIISGEQHPTVTSLLTILALSILLSWITYRFVETPLRGIRMSRKAIAPLVCCMSLVGIAGYAIFLMGGAPIRLNLISKIHNNEIRKVSNAWHFQKYPDPESYGFYKDRKFGFYRIGQESSKAILFVGDSHSQQYISTIGTLHQEIKKLNLSGTSTMFALEGGFPPKIEPKVISDPTISTVIFSYYWAYRYGSQKVNQAVRCCGGGKNYVVANTKFIPPLSSAEMDKVDQDLKELILKLHAAGKKVYLVLDNPFGEELDPHAMLDRSWLGISIKPIIDLEKGQVQSRAEPIRSRIIKIAKETRSRVIDPIHHLCTETICPAFSDNGELLYKDYDHLSVFALHQKVRYLDFLIKNSED